MTKAKDARPPRPKRDGPAAKTNPIRPADTVAEFGFTAHVRSRGE